MNWAALEKPRRRTKAQMDAVRVGQKSDDCGLSERAIQRIIIKGLRQIGIHAAHVPNGAHLAGDADARMRQMAALRADGLLPGFPDLILWRPLPAGPTQWGLLEVKRPGQTLSADQQAMRARLTADRVPWGAACSLDSALEVVRGWGWIG